MIDHFYLVVTEDAKQSTMFHMPPTALDLSVVMKGKPTKPPVPIPLQGDCLQIMQLLHEGMKDEQEQIRMDGGDVFLACSTFFVEGWNMQTRRLVPSRTLAPITLEEFRRANREGRNQAVIGSLNNVCQLHGVDLGQEFHTLPFMRFVDLFRNSFNTGVSACLNLRWEA